jgi:tripartite-type tricarboxylate transporter receptor subunit TctC
MKQRKEARFLGRWIAGALGAVTLAGVALAPASAQAQAAGAKPIWIVAPYAPGGGVDVYARMLAQEISPILSQPVAVENRPGASGNIGAEYVAKSAADGRTFMMNTNAYVINASVYKNLPYDPVKDLVPLSILGRVPLVIGVNANLPARTVAELVALTKAKDAKFAFSSCGNGTSQHLAGELFKSMTGADMVHVPYKGCAPATADVAAGQVQVSFTPVSVTMPFVQAGKMRALALTTKTRSPLAPNVPSAEEAGLRGYHVDQWFALFAPGKTPREAIDRMNAAIGKAIGREEFVKKLHAQGIEPAQSTHEEALQLVRSDIDRWGKLARELNLKLD